MAQVTWLILVAASLNTVHAVDIALRPCHAVFYLKNASQEFKFDSGSMAPGSGLSDCVFTLHGPKASSLKVRLHDVVEKDQTTGATMTEPLCIDGAVRIYEMTADGDLFISDVVCRSISNSSEVMTTYNLAVVTSTITSGTFGLSVSVVPGPISPAPHADPIDLQDPDPFETHNPVFEDTPNNETATQADGLVTTTEGFPMTTDDSITVVSDDIVAEGSKKSNKI